MQSITKLEEAFFRCTELDAAKLLIGECVNPEALMGLHNSQGIHLRSSPSVKEFLGYDRNELVGQSAYDFFHQKDFQKILKSHAQVNVTKEVTRVDYRIQKKDGSYRQVTTFSKTLKDRKGEEFILAFTF